MKTDIPHISFNLRSAVVKENPIHPTKRTVLVTMDGMFEDEEQWQAIHSKLVAGVKIYVSEDFKGELMMAAHEELGMVQRERNLLKLEVSKLTREKESLQVELDRKNDLLSVLEEGLRG